MKKYVLIFLALTLMMQSTRAQVEPFQKGDRCSEIAYQETKYTSR